MGVISGEFAGGDCTCGRVPDVWSGLFPNGLIAGESAGGCWVLGWDPGVWPRFVPRGVVVIGFDGPIVVVPGVVVFVGPPGFTGMGFVPGVWVVCFPLEAVEKGHPGTFMNIGGNPPLGSGGGAGIVTGEFPVLADGAPWEPATVGSA